MGEISRLPINPLTYIDRTIVDVEPDEIPSYGMFHVTFSNKRKQVNGLQRHTAQGALFTTGHIHIDTMYLQVRDFQTLQQMREYIEQFGECHISWLR